MTAATAALDTAYTTIMERARDARFTANRLDDQLFAGRDTLDAGQKTYLRTAYAIADAQWAAYRVALEAILTAQGVDEGEARAMIAEATQS